MTDTAAEITALMNPAGSTTKSTAAAALAHAEAQEGKRTLVVDLDPQGNLTTWLGGDRNTAGITQAITSASVDWPGIPAEEVRADLRRNVRRTIQHTAYDVDLIAGDIGLRKTVEAWSTYDENRRDYLLADIFAAVDDLYDAIILDSKGDLGVLTEAALRSIRPHDQTGRLTHAICVCLPETKSVVGLTTLQAEIDRMIEDGERVELAALIPAKIQHRSRSADADDVYQWMRESWGHIITPPIRKAPSLDGAYNSGAPVTAYDPRSGIAEDFHAVAQFLRDRKVLP